MSALLILSLSLLPGAHADNSSAPAVANVITNQGTNIVVSAVEANVFHIVASPANEPSPPNSPFVVENQPWTGATTHLDAAKTIVLQTPSAVLRLSQDGSFSVGGSAAPLICTHGQITTSPDSTAVSLQHEPNQRLYGAGNANMNSSGDLTHPSGAKITGNGVTRIPFLWSTGGYGVLIANNENSISWTDAQNTLTWQVPGPYVDMYIMVAPNGGYGLLDAYSRLTGRAPIPPLWSFGYMQSRWGYSGAADIQDKWHQFRNRSVPIDAFIYDYDWFENDWDFNRTNFPEAGLQELKSLGLHFVGIRKPRLTGAHLDYASQQGWILQNSYGTNMRYDIPAARNWWWAHEVPLVKEGMDGWWNDEAEQTYDEFFNMSMTEWQGLRAASPHRVWTLSRSFAPGMQRFGAAVWSGDITSTWSTLANQPGTMLNFSMAGMPFCSQDLGGFFGPPSPEMYARWIEEGVFIPVMRSHGMLNQDRWPWAFGDDAYAAAKQAIELRYRLIPYLYTCASQTSQTGAPIMRPLFFNYPSDTNTLNMQDEWMEGSSLLAAPILSQGGSRTVYLPAGRWYDFNTGASIEGPKTISITNAPLTSIPMYAPAGSILPLGPVMQHTGQQPEDPLEVRVYPGANGTFSLYEDAGDDYGYLKGESSHITFTWNDLKHSLQIAARTGAFPSMLNTHHFTIVLPDGRSKSVVYTGKAAYVQF